MFQNKWLLAILILIAVSGIAVFRVWQGTFRSSTSDVESPKTSDVFPRNVEEDNLDKTPIASGDKSNAPTQLEILAQRALDRQIPAGDAQITNELKSLSLQLSREPNYIQGWLQLGILRKFLKDYEGASLAWQYASVIRPENYIAFNNLADLYYYYLKDFPKAEAVLLEGISKNPKNPNLVIFLATLYQDHGDKPSARKYYEEALKLNPPNKEAIEQALAALDID